MSTPIFEMPEWTAAQVSPWITVMTALMRAEAFGQSCIVIQDQTLTAPPGTEVAGQIWFIAPAPTGAWTGHAGDLALYTGSSWEFLTPVQGWLLFDADVELTYQVNSTGGLDAVSLVPPTPPDFLMDIITTAATPYVPLAANGEKQYITQTSGSANAFELPQDSDQAFAIGTVLTFEQAGTGASAFTAGTGATIHSRDNALAFIGQYSIATAVKKAANTWSVTGDLEV